MRNPKGFELPRRKETSLADQERLLSSKDVAHMLDIGPDDVVQLVHRGKLRAAKVGRLWRYRVADVRVYKMRQFPKRDDTGSS